MGLDEFKTEDSGVSPSTGKVELDKSEVIRRFPHIEKIEDGAIKEEVIYLTATSPEYFWEVPASNSGHHHPICRKKCGLWAHTLMGATAYERLAETYLNQGLINEYELECGRAAILLHDQRKNGDPEEPSFYSTDDHDLHMGDVIANSASMPMKVINAVETHMGPWYDGPEPSSPLQKLVHNADMIASTQNITPTIYGSVPDELADIGVTNAF